MANMLNNGISRAKDTFGGYAKTPGPSHCGKDRAWRSYLKNQPSLRERVSDWVLV
jgi:hypothetical protein